MSVHISFPETCVRPFRGLWKDYLQLMTDEIPEIYVQTKGVKDKEKIKHYSISACIMQYIGVMLMFVTGLFGGKRILKNSNYNIVKLLNNA